MQRHIPAIIEEIKTKHPNVLKKFTNKDGTLRLFDLLNWYGGVN